MLTHDEAARLANLLTEWLPIPSMIDIVGVDPTDSFVQPSARAFATRMRREYQDKSGRFSRYVLEMWLQQSRLLPFHSAALRLGMTDPSLRSLLEALFNSGLVPDIGSHLPQSLVPEDLIRSFHRTFQSLRGRTFSTQSDFCGRLHEAAQLELALRIDPVYCEVSKIIDQERDYGYYECAVSHVPVGLRYAEAMDTKKPLRLAPDEVSWLALCRGYDEIKPHLMGTPPTHAQLQTDLKDACR